EQAIALFEHEIRHGTNSQVTAFASSALPMLRTHLSLAIAANKAAVTAYRQANGTQGTTGHRHHSTGHRH
ncbi:MAG: hypothetical protein ACRDJU_02905, partial [Actinomycetota bacterium]